MEANRLRPTDRVTIDIAVDGKTAFTFTGEGFRNIDGAAEAAYRASGIMVPKEDCVFSISDQAEGTAQRYRLTPTGISGLLYSFRIGIKKQPFLPVRARR